LGPSSTAMSPPWRHEVRRAPGTARTEDEGGRRLPRGAVPPAVSRPCRHPGCLVLFAQFGVLPGATHDSEGRDTGAGAGGEQGGRGARRVGGGLVTPSVRRAPAGVPFTGGTRASGALQPGRCRAPHVGRRAPHHGGVRVCPSAPTCATSRSSPTSTTARP